MCDPCQTLTEGDEIAQKSMYFLVGQGLAILHNILDQLWGEGAVLSFDEAVPPHFFRSPRSFKFLIDPQTSRDLPIFEIENSEYECALLCLAN